MASPPILAEHDGVVVRPLTGDADLADTLELLSAGERALGAPLVDEAEQQRLARRSEDPAAHPPGWRPVVAVREGQVVGYGGLTAPGQPGAAVTGDAAADPRRPPTSATLAALLEGLEVLAREEAASGLQVWVRHAGQDEVDLAAGQGFGVARRLGVLGRSLQEPLPAQVEGPATIRSFRPGEDDEAVVEVLAAAYADTPEAGWDLDQLRERQALPWFRAEDLLLARLTRDDGEDGDGEGDEQGLAAGIHWLKRREPGVGEVYNLAIHPRAQGHGVGALLLRAGLVRLADVGCREVVLWVDLGNERAVRLYASQGFETRWQDLALAKRLQGGGSGR
jgi:mycothiol synthase